ncbi:hypothetical protein PSYMO_36091, partial [Pseudomonas amygdali pv. mori str. 301020]
YSTHSRTLTELDRQNGFLGGVVPVFTNFTIIEMENLF